MFAHKISCDHQFDVTKVSAGAPCPPERAVAASSGVFFLSDLSAELVGLEAGNATVGEGSMTVCWLNTGL